MNQRVAFALLLLALSGCGGHPPLAEPTGPVRALNPGRWTPSAGDLQAVPVGEDAR